MKTGKTDAVLHLFKDKADNVLLQTWKLDENIFF